MIILTGHVDAAATLQNSGLGLIPVHFSGIVPGNAPSSTTSVYLSRDFNFGYAQGAPIKTVGAMRHFVNE